MKKYNRSHFKIKTLNKEKLFNKICKQFELFDIKQEEQFTKFEVEERQADKLEKFLRENNVKIEQIKHLGLRKRLKKFFKM